MSNKYKLYTLYIMYDDLYLNIYILTMASVLTVQDKYNVHINDKNNKI